MEKDKKSSEDLNPMAEQTVQQAREAMENYLNFFQKNMYASPWAKRHQRDGDENSGGCVEGSR